MRRRFGAAVAVLAFLCAFTVAPYRHAHHSIDSVSDEHHPHGHSLVHTHASSHSSHDAGRSDPEPTGEHEGDDGIWSVNSFVSSQPAPGHAPSPAPVAVGEPHVHLTGTWLGASRPQPRANGPPAGAPSGLRAPPAFLPLFA